VAKRIVVCLDGTWNKPGQTEDGVATKTNVLKLYDALANGPDQVAGYIPGVGSDPGTKVRGGAFGWGLFEQIRMGYRFVREQLVPGDDIYMFGFSRGAYSARSLAGMILRCGVVRRDVKSLMLPQLLAELLTTRDGDDSGIDVVDQAFALYKHGYDKDNRAEVEALKRQNCDDTGIRLVGVWDTVGSLGIPDDLVIPVLRGLDRKLDESHFGFLDTDLGARVQAAYHALAIDEHRKPFLPTLWTEPPGATPRVNVAGTNVEQVWFAGAHSNVGGGYADAGLSDIALQWMIERARGQGLDFAGTASAALHPDATAERRDSLDEFIEPGAGRRNWLLTWIDHVVTRLVKKNRPIPEGSRIHASVNTRLSAGAVSEPGKRAPYRPAATLKLAERDGVRAVDPQRYRIVV
jgi:uncharacterized protein (DUF2235 family)